MYSHDTIAAIATPQGSGGIGVIRISGPAAESIGNSVFLRRVDGCLSSHHLYHGRVIGPDGAELDDCLAVLMRGPRSYTGEDVFELHCHGSPIVLRRALEAVLRRGARPAVAGEFTKRAFLNGKLDLAQAEAVADLIAARTPESAGQAADQLFGRLSRHLDGLRQRLIRVKALLEVQIDFADDDIVVDPAAALADIEAVLDETDRLLATHVRGRLVRQGLRVAIAGPPNVGKSSLLNALLGEDRAIVTALAGTTRDVIEESADFAGVPVVLSDTAGLREAPGEVERIGIDRALQVAAAADVVIAVLDASQPPDCNFQLPAAERAVIALNKIDLPLRWSEGAISALCQQGEVVRVSAKDGVGLDELRRSVLARAGGTAGDGLPVLTRARQLDAMAKARESLLHARSGLLERFPPDLVAVDVQAALDHIGSVTGAVTSEDVLDAIFSEFCIGK